MTLSEKALLFWLGFMLKNEKILINFKPVAWLTTYTSTCNSIIDSAIAATRNADRGKRLHMECQDMTWGCRNLKSISFDELRLANIALVLTA